MPTRLLVRPMTSSFNFDGTDTVITAGDNSAHNFTTAMSIAAWIKPTSAGEGSLGRIVEKNGSTSKGWIFALNDSLVDDGILFSRSGINKSSNAEVIKYGVWQHIVTAFNNVSTIFYVNGVAAGSVAEVAELTSEASTLRIGDRGAGGRAFKGKMRDIMIWNVKLDATQVSALYFNNIIPATGLVSHWKFDDNTGTSLTDSVGGYTGTITAGSGGWSVDIPMKLRTVI